MRMSKVFVVQFLKVLPSPKEFKHHYVLIGYKGDTIEKAESCLKKQ